ncbi:molecular chaperone [Shewanella sp. 3_MG-2023]|uniref:molecular chaperone n=1 Tax=Shewanella sp. 3_MG-2023 TaxID=3062635 RepID=UPI0026E3C26E|nr:molecular chaperone [Shewanella sp. 3_MG-2023]MDO6774830.1 molecular chaperone [Shewanella sp. 3_MG-2023]
MIKNMTKSCLVAMVSLIIVFSLPNAFAYKVQPMVAEMSPVGKKAQLNLRIENNDSESLTVEMIPLQLVINNSGKIEYIPAEDDLLIIPVTAILKPGHSQAVMVRYLGEPDIAESKAYSVGFRQIPITMEGDNISQVKMGVNFNTLINVVPTNTKANLLVKELKLIDGEWKITINNSGNRYVRLSETQWQVSDGANSLQLNKEQLSELLNGNLFLPNSSRTLTMKPIESFSMDKIEIKIEIMK